MRSRVEVAPAKPAGDMAIDRGLRMLEEGLEMRRIDLVRLGVQEVAA
jgi:hypothetical protein